MDPNQNTPPNYKNRKPDNAFALDTTPRQFPTMESPQGGLVNLLQTGKNTGRPNTTQERIPWTKEEEEKLAEAWISASQDPIEGNSQAFGCFGEKVCAVFYELTGSESRNPDQINLKWRYIRLKCTEFGEIYNNLLNIRKSGANDCDVFKAGLDQFEKITPTRKAFPYVKHWLKLKDALKWKEQTEGSSQSSGSKRSRNSDGMFQQSDGRTHFDIKDDPLDIEDEQPLRRPVGRSKAKKKKSGFNSFGI
ncbi:glutathione S-transferase T3-like [Lactuca sativa]|uniref:glutathione S-transferase T3-like n=1 Tax=Lactuca sativa TaxID=4236 RepID=UPI000CD970FF|nr:glutathione S-transferase T3-like [Lactuca sativa]